VSAANGLNQLLGYGTQLLVRPFFIVNFFLSRLAAVLRFEILVDRLKSLVFFVLIVVFRGETLSKLAFVFYRLSSIFNLKVLGFLGVACAIC
jgi:hypothetical protein